MDIPKRKSNRLQSYDYSQQGCYFLTLCAKDRLPLFGSISLGTDSTPPETDLSDFGKVVCNQLQNMISAYHDIQIEKYVIMPNHVHLLITLCYEEQSRSPQNSRIPFWVSTFKRFTNKISGQDLWQRSYYDHIIRDEEDFLIKWNYIDNNPTKWTLDDMYVTDPL